MAVVGTSSFFEKVYKSFPYNRDTYVRVSEKRDREDELDAYDNKINYLADSFFSITALNLWEYSDSNPLSLELDIQPLSSFSIHLPQDLIDLSQDSDLTLAEKVKTATNFIHQNYGITKGLIWKTKKVSWNLTHLPFFLHLWSKPNLIKRTATFAVAREYHIHSMVNQDRESLKASKETLQRTTKWMVVLCLIQLVLLYFFPPRVPIISDNSHKKDRNVPIPISEAHQKKLDAKALEMTNDPEAALHYLECLQVDSKYQADLKKSSQSNADITKESTNRITNLKIVLSQKEMKGILPRLKKYAQAVALFFQKIVRFFFNITNDAILIAPKKEMTIQTQNKK